MIFIFIELISINVPYSANRHVAIYFEQEMWQKSTYTCNFMHQVICNNNVVNAYALQSHKSLVVDLLIHDEESHLKKLSSHGYSSDLWLEHWHQFNTNLQILIALCMHSNCPSTNSKPVNITIINFLTPWLANHNIEGQYQQNCCFPILKDDQLFT